MDEKDVTQKKRLYCNECSGDPSSDYFRYPMSRGGTDDKEKSPFREVPVGDLFPAEPPNEYVKALVVEDENGNWVRAFKLDAATNQVTSDAAWKAEHILYCFHAMMRFELTGGW